MGRASVQTQRAEVKPGEQEQAQQGHTDSGQQSGALIRRRCLGRASLALTYLLSFLVDSH